MNEKERVHMKKTEVEVMPEGSTQSWSRVDRLFEKRLEGGIKEVDPFPTAKIRGESEGVGEEK